MDEEQPPPNGGADYESGHEHVTQHCIECGQAIPVGKKLCSHCGAALSTRLFQRNPVYAPTPERPAPSIMSRSGAGFAMGILIYLLGVPFSMLSSYFDIYTPLTVYIAFVIVAQIAGLIYILLNIKRRGSMLPGFLILAALPWLLILGVFAVCTGL